MNGIKGYISIREASYKWGVSERRVNQYCVQGRIRDFPALGAHGLSRRTRRNRKTRERARERARKRYEVTVHER